MASTYSTSLGLELIGQGEQSGTWGITTNNNFGTLVEQAITGVQAITMTDATYTLSVYQGASDEARNAVLVLSGTLTAGQNLIAPSVQKVYIIKTSTGTGVAILSGSYVQVYCDGTEFYNATPSANSVTGNLAVSGSGSFGNNVSITNNATVGGNLSVTGSISAASITGVTGRVVQTAQSVYTTTVGYSGGADYPTGHTVSITPTSSSSKFLVMLTASLAQSNFGFALNAYLTMVRSGTNLTGGEPVDLSVSCQSGVNANFYGTISYQFLDQPATTSTIIYQPYINTSGYVVYNNQQRAILTVLEIL
jgi:hypothetical protein